MSDETVRFEIRVKPGAKGTSVGGTWGEDGPLNVTVRERAVDGKANDAALSLLATVLRLRKRHLRLISGHKSRVKVVEATGERDRILERLEHWRSRH